MKIFNQKTLRDEIKFKGIGLHSGAEVNLIVKPSKPNSGITFKRVDIKKIISLKQILKTWWTPFCVPNLRMNME